MGDQLPALPPEPISRDLVKEIAMDIGKQVAAYIEHMYPAAVTAASSTFLLSVRNCTYNEVMAALGLAAPDAIKLRLEANKHSRRKLRALWRAARGLKPGDDARAINIARYGAGLAPDVCEDDNAAVLLEIANPRDRGAGGL